MMWVVSTPPMPDSQPSALEIHPGLILKGQLSMAKDVVLTGKFEGDLQTLGSLTVTEGGTLVGTIDVGGLVLKAGNLVEARVRVGAQARPAEKTPSEAAKPAFGGWKRGFQKLKELTRGKA